MNPIPRPAAGGDEPKRTAAQGGSAADAGEASGEQGSFERVQRGILHGLFEGRLVPGQRLAEPDLMRQFNVGRGTVREVLNRLSAVGVVTMVRHRGAAVHRLSRTEVYQLLDVVAVLFSLAARNAARHAVNNPGAVDLLKAADVHLRSFQATDDFTGFAEARGAYYQTVMDISGNKEIRRVFPLMKVHIMRLQLRHFLHTAGSLQIDDYHAVTEAILSGDEDHAEVTAREHIDHMARRIAAVPERAFAAA